MKRNRKGSWKSQTGASLEKIRENIKNDKSLKNKENETNIVRGLSTISDPLGSGLRVRGPGAR